MKQKKWTDCPACGAKGSMQLKRKLSQLLSEYECKKCKKTKILSEKFEEEIKRQELRNKVKNGLFAIFSGVFAFGGLVMIRDGADGGWKVFLIFFPMFLVFTIQLTPWWEKNLLNRKMRHQPQVTCSEEGILLTDRKKRVSISWNMLREVMIYAQDAFPIGNISWVFMCQGALPTEISWDSKGAESLLKEMQTRLPGFDNDAVIQASGMMQGIVKVWQRADFGILPTR